MARANQQRSTPALSTAEKKRIEDRQQWLIMGGGLGGLVLLIGGFLVYAAMSNAPEVKPNLPTPSPVVVTPRNAAPVRAHGAAPFSPSSTSSSEAAYYESVALDPASIEKASRYKNRNSAGRLNSKRVTLSRSPYTEKIENRRERNARVKKIEAYRNGRTEELRSKREKNAAKAAVRTTLSSAPPKEVSAEEMGKRMKNLLGQ